MHYTKEQFEKLPKWAQIEINTLTSTVKNLESRIEAYYERGETETYICDGLDLKGLPKGSCIEFKTGQRYKNKVSVRVERSGKIYFNSDSRTGQSMAIRPSAANAFYIDFID